MGLRKLGYFSTFEFWLLSLTWPVFTRCQSFSLLFHTFENQSARSQGASGSACKNRRAWAQIRTRAHLLLRYFQETIYFGLKGNFHVTSRLLSGILLLYVNLDDWENLFFVYKQIDINKVMLGSSQDSKLKIFVLARNSWSLGNIPMISAF